MILLFYLKTDSLNPKAFHRSLFSPQYFNELLKNKSLFALYSSPQVSLKAGANIHTLFDSTIHKSKKVQNNLNKNITN